MSDLPDPLPSTITWKFTLNCNLLPPNINIDQVVRDSNYPYFCRNGQVFKSDTLEFTGIFEDDLDYSY